MALFAIADLHLSLGSKKPMDIFPGWENYRERIEKNWRLAVGETDTVIIPGDLSWAMSLEEAIRDFQFLNALPGQKIVIKGNHDYWWTTMRKMEKFLQEQGLDSIKILHNSAVAVGNVSVCGTRGWFYDDAQSEDKKILLREAGRLNASIEQAEKTGLEPVAFLHYPPVYGSFVCGEILDVLKQHSIKRCFYGHLHAKAAHFATQGLYEGICFRLVSADSIGFAPVVV